MFFALEDITSHKHKRRHKRSSSARTAVLMRHATCLCRYCVQWGHVGIAISISQRLSGNQLALYDYVGHVLTQQLMLEKKNARFWCMLMLLSRPSSLAHKPVTYFFFAQYACVRASESCAVRTLWSNNSNDLCRLTLNKLLINRAGWFALQTVNGWCVSWCYFGNTVWLFTGEVAVAIRWKPDFWSNTR